MSKRCDVYHLYTYLSCVRSSCWVHIQILSSFGPRRTSVCSSCWLQWLSCALTSSDTQRSRGGWVADRYGKARDSRTNNVALSSRRKSVTFFLCATGHLLCLRLSTSFYACSVHLIRQEFAILVFAAFPSDASFQESG